MKNKAYLIIAGGILLITVFSLKMYKAEKEIKWNSNKVCNISEFKDMNYYVLCDTALNAEVTDIVHTYSIYGRDADDTAKGEKLYQEYKNAFLTNAGIYNEKKNDNIVYVSPDCKWVILENVHGENEYGEVLRQQTLYYEKNMKKQTVSTYSRISPVTVIKDEFGYKEMEEALYQKFIKLNDLSYSEGYYRGLLINEKGNLAVGVKEKLNESLDVWDIESQQVIWSLPLTDIQDKVWSEVVQFYSDGNGGQIIIKCNRSFYEISYPSDEIRFLGKDMYSLSYSPDMKYIVYAGIDNEAGLELEPDELAELLSGIYIKEIKTGRTAYIECNNEWWQVNGRNFCWMEKDAVNLYINMGKKKDLCVNGSQGETNRIYKGRF